MKMDKQQATTTARAMETLADALAILASEPQRGDKGDGDGNSEAASPPDATPPASEGDGAPAPDAGKRAEGFKPRGGLSALEDSPDHSREIKALLRKDRNEADPKPTKTSPGFLVVDCPKYKIHTTKHDRVVKANVLRDEINKRFGLIPKLTALRDKLDALMSDGSLVSRLAAKLQRVIMAQQTRAWSFDQEDGRLDPARLARIVSSPTAPTAYKIEREAPFKETAVTLLLDNSGSMIDADKIQIAAMTGDILARVLERCGVAVEILGFTTDPKVRPYYAEGRLDDLWHIVYKDFSVPYRRSRENFGLMLAGRGALNENVDGEALIWAYNRLMCRPEPRRVLVVLSDGEPAAHYGGAAGAFSAHLHAVIGAIEARPHDAELFAIGCCHDVTPWYRHAATVRNPADVGPVLMAELTKLFTPKPTTTKSRGR